MVKYVVLGFVLVCFLIYMPYFVDDIACDGYRSEIENAVSGVSGIEVLDMLNGCGNVANGDHTDLIVGVLIKTDLTIEELKSKFSDAYRVISFDKLSVNTKLYQQFSKHTIDDTEQYFVLVYAKSAPFWFIDFRGH